MRTVKTGIQLLIILLLATACRVQSGGPAGKRKATRLWATYYYVPVLKHADTGIPLRNTAEEDLPLKLRPCDWCKAALQGSAYVLKDTKMHFIEYAGRSAVRQYDCRECDSFRNYKGYDATGKVRWKMGSGQVTGASGLPLVPFRSIAVDPTVIPFRSVVYVPAADGVLYQDTNGQFKKHDGYFLAADTGSMIKGRHIDVYIGTALKNPFDFVKSSDQHLFEAYIVEDTSVQERLLKMHR